MSTQELYNVRSFVFVIYDSAYEELAHYQVAVSVAAPFANRLFREVPQVQDLTANEPWYVLAHRYDLHFRRSPLPPGPTSIYGQRYDPAALAPPTIRLHPDALVRYFVVQLLDYDKELYRGIYSVDDIFLHGVHYLLHHRIQKGDLPGDRGPYYYGIVPSARAIYTIPEDLLPEDAYEVEGMFRLPPQVRDEPRIQFRRIPEPPLAEHNPVTFEPVRSMGKGEPQAGRVLIPSQLYEDLCRNLILGLENEEGGYILGNVYRLPGSPEEEDDPDFRWVVEVSDLLMAEGTVGSPALLLFTGDSWSKVRRQIARDYPDRKLVGWFHTHTFPASDTFGLSGLDQDMHAWYLPKPWQVAILLNLENGADRTVRCYQRGPEGDLVETPFEVLQAPGHKT